MIKKALRFILKKTLSTTQISKIISQLQSMLPRHLDKREMFYYINNLKLKGYKPDFVIDIGAYQGDWTLDCLKIFPEAKFLMLEAQKNKKTILEKICLQHNNASQEICMLGKENNQDVQFYEMETGSSIYEEQSSHARTVQIYSMKTLDDIAKKFNIEGEVFLKLDVQGAEKDILEGAKTILPHVSFIILETSLLDYNKNAPLIGDIIEFMKRTGFVLFDICEQHRKTDDTLFQVDLLFSRTSSVIRRKLNVFTN